MTCCVHCRRELTSARRFYCSPRCRTRAYRRRRAGLPQDAFAEGAQRGRVPLDGKTLRQLADECAGVLLPQL